MNKNFGYTKKGGQDWFSSDAYSTKEIEEIKDPEGGSEISLPTAIPSPFARIDLVKTAFKNIAQTPELKTYTNKDGTVLASKNDEKLVSECFDIAELLFNYNHLRDKIKFIVWDKNDELRKLKASSDKHRRFAETLELYLDQDKKSYNFDKFTKFYLIEYNQKIIGCTSPVTLFFSTANDLTHAQIQLTGNDVLFDEHYASLYERDIEFQKNIYLLFKANPDLSELMPDFYEYLEKNKKILEKSKAAFCSELNNLNEAEYKALYAELKPETGDSEIEVLTGVGLRKRKSEDIVNFISNNSDFRIVSTKVTGDNRPLVLQNDFSKDWLYAKEKWHKFKVPFTEKEGMDRRRLPGINVLYPYLTISDFLEPYLIRLVYPINKDKFFDGNLIAEVGDDSKGYILPLKKQFFDYFTSEELIGGGQSKPTIKMIQGVANSVKVVLKIPVEKSDEYITFERNYFESAANQITKPDEESNKGIIIEQQVGVTLFPFIKTNDGNITPFYRIQLVDRDVSGNFKHADYDLKFFSNKSNDAITYKAKKIRSKKRPDAVETATSQYYVLENEFDFIQIKNQSEPGAAGIIIPNWQPYQSGGDVFSFAVDFGTTNTHIEYKVGSGSPISFDITTEDIQLATLFHPTKTTEDFGGTGAIAIRELIKHEFVPQLLGNKSDYKFPHRTVIAQSHSLNIQTPTYSLADFNIPFIYEREVEKDKIIPNLKWAKNEAGNQIRVERFLENIIMLLRNKVLLNKGDLPATRLVWFYPSSMKPVRKSGLEKIWNKLFLQYFKPINTPVETTELLAPSNAPVGITESIAPFYYFKGANKLQGGEVVSIDIGGGTTDVVVFKAKTPLLLTSFKFAANTLFGDGFSEYGAAKTNGLVNKYFPYYENLLAINKLYNLSKVLSSIKDKNITEDINAFFFSIENNPKIEGKELYSYNSLLAGDEDLKIVFLYFYAAIIYHIAKLMKVKNLEMPKHLVFSGTGSKILNIITPDIKTLLAKFSTKIFEGVYEKTFDSEGLTIETEREMPKEVTCKGGLMLDPDDLKVDINEIKAVLTCLEHKDINKFSMDKLDTSAKDEIIKFVTDFNNFFLEINRQFSFKSNFGVSSQSLDKFRNEANKYLKDYLEEGLEYNRKLDEAEEGDKELEETLFFYPITGTINNLIGHLATISPVNS